jgi:hypothetical protein
VRRLELDVDEIVRLYRDVGWRSQAIAEKFGCTAETVLSRLEEAGVPRSRHARLARDEVIRRYQLGESAISIARDYGVTGPTVTRNLQRWGIATRSHVEARQPWGRRPAPGILAFRAYALGFAAGDLFVHRLGGPGSSVHVSSSTTDEAQRELMRDVFGAYGNVVVSGTTVRVSLDDSFDFLQAKYESEIPAWVAGPLRDPYFAGYVDAEGSFGVYGGRGRFKIDSYDAHVLGAMAVWCSEIGVSAKHWRVAERGETRADGTRFNGDLWRVNVNDGPSLLRLIATLEPFLRHNRRRVAADRVRCNVVERLSKRVRP